MKERKYKMKNKSLEEFVRKAQRILEEKKVRKHRNLYIGALDQEIEIESLTDEEIEEWLSYEDKNRQDAYLCYLGSPSLRELAEELKNLGYLAQDTQVADILPGKDKLEIGKQILELSGMFAKTTVREVEHSDDQRE